MNKITPYERRSVQMSRFVGVFLIINKYSVTMNPAMYCYHNILKHSDYFLRDEAFTSLIFEWSWDSSLVGYGIYE